MGNIWIDLPQGADVPPGVTSFAALDASKHGNAAAEQISTYTFQFRELVRNALGDPAVTDKDDALNALIDELQTLISDVFDDEKAAGRETSKKESSGEAGRVASFSEQRTENNKMKTKLTTGTPTVLTGAPAPKPKAAPAKPKRTPQEIEETAARVSEKFLLPHLTAQTRRELAEARKKPKPSTKAEVIAAVSKKYLGG